MHCISFLAADGSLLGQWHLVATDWFKRAFGNSHPEDFHSQFRPPDDQSISVPRLFPEFRKPRIRQGDVGVVVQGVPAIQATSGGTQPRMEDVRPNATVVFDKQPGSIFQGNPDSSRPSLPPIPQALDIVFPNMEQFQQAFGGFQCLLGRTDQSQQNAIMARTADQIPDGNGLAWQTKAGESSFHGIGMGPQKANQVNVLVNRSRRDILIESMDEAGDIPQTAFFERKRNGCPNPFRGKKVGKQGGTDTTRCARTAKVLVSCMTDERIHAKTFLAV